MVKNVETLEAMFKGLIKEGDFTTQEILLALHNVSSHGTLLEEHDGANEVDDYLELLFIGYKTSLTALEKMGF